MYFLALGLSLSGCLEYGRDGWGSILDHEDRLTP